MKKKSKGYNPNLLEDGKNTRFPHNDPTKGGRKPSIYTQLKKLTKKEFEVELTKEDYERTFAWVLEQTPNTLADLGKKEVRDNIPFFMLSLIKAITSDMDNGNINNLNSIMDRVFGKTVQKTENVEINMSDKIDTSKLTEEQKDLLFQIGTDLLNEKED